MLNQSKGVFNMRDQRKAETIAQQRMELISPLLAEGLDPAKAKEIKARICEQTGISERTLRRYVAQYREAGFDGLKPKGKSQRKTEDAIPSHVLEQAILLRRQVPSRSVSQLIKIVRTFPGQGKDLTDVAVAIQNDSQLRMLIDLWEKNAYVFSPASEEHLNVLLNSGYYTDSEVYSIDPRNIEDEIAKVKLLKKLSKHPDLDIKELKEIKDINIDSTAKSSFLHS
jgi:hypothetical protein